MFGLLLLMLAVLLGGACDPPTDRSVTGENVPLIRNEGEYSLVLEEVRRLSEGPLRAHDQEEELSEQDLKDLRRSAALFQGMIAFKPTAFGPYFGSGKIHNALGDRARAGRQFEMALLNVPQQPTIEHIVLVGEAHDLLAQLLLAEGEIDRAKQQAVHALELYPENPNYLATLAAVELRRDEIEEASRLVGKALMIDRENKRALRLAKLIDLESGR